MKLLSSLFKNNNNNYESLFIDISKENSGIYQNYPEDDLSKDDKILDSNDNQNYCQEYSKDEEESSKNKKPKIPNLPLTLNNQSNNQLDASNQQNHKQNKMKIPNLKLTMKGGYGDYQENVNLEENDIENETENESQKEGLFFKEQQINFEFPKKSFRKDKESSFDERNSENSMKRAQIKNLELSFSFLKSHNFS